MSPVGQKIQTNGLVLYKSRPAVVRAISDKIDIEYDGGSKRVREKDVTPLHPGPVSVLPGGVADAPGLDDARELLLDEALPFEDFADLLYGEFTPASAWGAWQLLNEGLYFSGEADAVKARPAELVEEDIAKRDAKAREKADWEEMLERLKKRQMAESDRPALVEVERVAHAESDKSRILDAIDLSVTPANAHRLLVQIGYWSEEYNPHPRRHGISLDDNLLDFDDPAEPQRTDLRDLIAWAIDDAGSQDPDDAISLDGDRLYVHVADAAAIVQPGSNLDEEARSRGANLYLPDRVIHMLPHAMTQQLGLGLQEISPALSISFIVDDAGELDDIRIETSLVRVTRTSYDAADHELDGNLAGLKVLTDRIAARRLQAGAATLDLPEVNVRVIDDEIVIQPYQRGGSRQLVTEAMLAAGEAVAKYAQEHTIAIPFASQPEPDEVRQPQTMSETFAYRRMFKPSRGTVEPAPHFGLGLPHYTRTTSPLRRYPDLLAHQQLHAWLRGDTLLDESQVSERLSIAESASRLIRKGERLSNQHWKLLYLHRNREWQGEAVVAELDERKMTLIIPQLALEMKQRRVAGLELDQQVRLAVDSINISDLEARFRILG
ncbi:hypothetical protein BOW28_03890 [Solemya velum gill symbiont]|nr:hypothetical protein BOW28_03890 [Solemya velum gill symbiont]